MTSIKAGIVLLSLAVSFFPLSAQEDIENLYLRKAVKEFIAREYDNTISNLEQVVAVNPKNDRAKKLMSKAFVMKGQQALAQNHYDAAAASFEKAISFDSTNSSARKGLAAAKQQEAFVPMNSHLQKSTSSAQQPQTQAPEHPFVVQQAPPTIIQTSPSGGPDSVSAKVIQNILTSFNENQKIIARQIEQSNSLVNRTDSSKDKYLDALLSTSKQNNDKMMRYIVIGGAAVVLFVIIFVVAFFLFFYSVNKNTELRTVKVAQSVAALLAAPASAQPGAAMLRLTGPSQDTQAGKQDIQQAQSIQDDSETALCHSDPLKRAYAIESVEREIIKSKEAVPPERIKKIMDLLNDDNNRVRANAAKAIYSIDNEASLSTLGSMLRNPSKRMRASSIWALGEIGSEKALDLILSLPDETDEMLTYNIKMALEKIKNGTKIPFDDQKTERIDAVILKYREMV
jgi:tetratricopeptide (TPR) repeat protein